MKQVYKKRDIEVPDSNYNQWIQYLKGFKTVRVKRIEEDNCVVCYGNVHDSIYNGEVYCTVNGMYDNFNR